MGSVGVRLPMFTFVAMLACPAPESTPTLVIDGPAEVRVQELGPVDLPLVVVRRGDVVAEGAAITWSVEPADGGSIEGGRLHVVGAGQGTVTASFEGAQGSFALVVAPPVTLSYVNPPGTLAVGASVQLVTGTRTGDRPSMIESVPTFVSSNDAVATVSPTGMVTAVTPGIVYITGRQGEAEAMVEIEVR